MTDPGRTGTGPLAGVRVVELAGIGPAPLAGMLLADLGADVVFVERPAATGIAALVPKRHLITNRGKRLTRIDLKSEAGRAQLLELASRADVLIEGLRPGAIERLGLGPNDLHRVNPALVICRVTGWGQTGPRARTAGHDITYIAMTGALDLIGRRGEPPVPPINFLGDYAGGTMFAVVGILAALLEARRSGRGQVVDAAMTDGVGALLAPLIGMVAGKRWIPERGSNLFDTGAPFYDVYRTKDGRWLALGALEDEFFAQLAKGLGLSEAEIVDRGNPARWPALRKTLDERVASRTRDEWVAIFEGTDACVAPVLGLEEAVRHPDNVARGAFVDVDGVPQPAPAPRLSRTPLRPPAPPPETFADPAAIAAEWTR